MARTSTGVIVDVNVHGSFNQTTSDVCTLQLPFAVGQFLTDAICWCAIIIHNECLDNDK